MKTSKFIHEQIALALRVGRGRQAGRRAVSRCAHMSSHSGLLRALTIADGLKEIHR